MHPLSVLRPKSEIQVQAGCTPAGGSRRGPSCLSQHLGPQVPSDLQPCPSRLSHSLSCHQPLDLRTTSFTFTTSADPERQVGTETPGWAKSCWHEGLGVARVGCLSADLWVACQPVRKALEASAEVRTGVCLTHGLRFGTSQHSICKPALVL